MSVTDWGLVPSDDEFHPPPTDDPWWLETAWYGWMVPEAKMLGSFYVGLRANQGIQFGGVSLFDDTAELPWEILFNSTVPHAPLPSAIDLRGMDFGNGMTLACVESGRVYDVGFDHPDLSLDLRFEALMQPLLTRGAPPFVDAAHIDQLGHVTGTTTLRGETLDVDCFTIRDRMWGLRRASRNPDKQPPVGYCYATASASEAFLAISVLSEGVDSVVRGFLMRDGVWAPLTTGVREVRRDDAGRPVRVGLEATDDLGRALHAEGTVHSRHASGLYSHFLCWVSLTSWTFDGHEGWGEDQDVWPPRRWRRLRGLG